MEHQEPQSDRAPYKKKVLIADDSQVALSSLEKMLSGGLFQTIRASNGKEAYDKAYQRNPRCILRPT